MPPRSESMPPPGGLGASRWAAPPGPAPSAPRPAIPRLAALRLAAPAVPATEPNGSPSANSTNSTNTFDTKPPKPHQPGPTTVEESTGGSQANTAPRTCQNWHHIEETDSKLILHLGDIECVVRGTVESKDGISQQAPTIRATAKLSIELDKVLVLGKNHDFMTTNKGGFLENGSTVSLNAEGEGRLGQSPVLVVVIDGIETKKPSEPTEAGTTLAAARKPFPPTSRDVAIDLTSLEFEKEDQQLPEVVQKLSAEATAKAEAAVEAADLPPTASVAVSSSEDNGGTTPSRSVIIAGLPYGFKVKQVLDLIEPTKNTRVIEIKLTKAYAALLGFLTPAGAQDFLSQRKSGFITFPYEDEELGMVEWRSRILPWGAYVPVKPESLRGYIDKGATRYLCIRGRSPITIREVNLTWSLDHYRHCLGSQIYDGHVYRDDQDSEVAELEFLSVSRAISALHFFKPRDGFARAIFTFLPDRHVLT